MASMVAFKLKLVALLYIQALFEVGHAQNGPLLKFGDTVQILGAMERTNSNFQDGFSVDMLSPKNRTLTVRQNESPVGARAMFSVKGAADSFEAVSNSSYRIEMNEPANDLIASIAIPFDPVNMMARGLSPANTFVARLAADNRSWVIDEEASIVQRNESKTRCVKMTSVSGEFLLVGRQASATEWDLKQYGGGPNNTVNLVGGAGRQEVEFIDGLKFSVQTNASMSMTVQLDDGVNPGTLNDNVQALNSFTWVIRTSAPFQAMNATVEFPFNRDMLAALHPEGSSPTTMLTVGRRALNATSGTFLPFHEGGQTIKELPDDKIVVESVGQLDGHFLMMVEPARNINRKPKPA